MSSFEIFGFKPNMFVLHNARPEPITLKWAARMFTIPAINQVGESPGVFNDGSPIPGTIALTDSYTPGADGTIPENGSQPNWRAFDAIRNLLGFNPVTKRLEGHAAKSGVSFIPNNISKEEFEGVKADGIIRYRQSMVDWADGVIRGYELAVQRNREAGLMAPPPNKDYKRAVSIINAKVDEQQQLEDGPNEDEELAFMAYAEAEAAALAKKAASGKDIDETELAKRLLEKPEILDNLRKKYKFRIRKVGYVGLPTEVDEED